METISLFHSALLLELQKDYTASRKPLLTRFQIAEGLSGVKRVNGDELIKKATDLFANGMGVKWSPVQLDIFNKIVDSCLPIFYRDEWEENSTRVLAMRGLLELRQEVLVNMARRNGKTWTVAGACAALWLTVPNISIGVFSVAKRQSALFMSAAVDKIKGAYALGTHVTADGFEKITENQEHYSFYHPKGGKQQLSCYPGSIKVS